MGSRGVRHDREGVIDVALVECWHMKLQHGVQRPAIADNFTVLKKCGSKLDCLVSEMLLIKELKPSLNVQSDSIRAVIH